MFYYLNVNDINSQFFYVIIKILGLDKKIYNSFIRYARKPQAFKPGDEWHPGTKPVLAGAVEENQA